MQKRIVSFVPLQDNNAYIYRMKELISHHAEVKPIKGLKKAFKDLLVYRKRPYDIVWFNFEENKIIDDNGGIAITATIKLFIRTFIISSFSNKSIFVRHNHYPHKTIANKANLAKKIVDYYERIFDHVITHSGAEVTNQKIYCPHPLYKIADSKQQNKVLSLPSEYFLVFGRIVPYKKIEKLIEKFPHDKMLVVAGAVGDEGYAKQLANINHPGLIFLPGYLSESESQHLVRNSTAVIISHADKDMIVSGSFFYAISVQAPVIAIRTDFFNWIQEVLPNGVLTLANNLDDIKNVLESYQRVDFSESLQKNINQQFSDLIILEKISNLFK